ncbi:unnamed protein product [Microthlaspi erraticum]|uniref:Uncharacterized protein n=1 Tax=Microthlaspi erraticum TaxID=1685480 RepID=A0A6D2KXQ7_9BRAS|nr:unnamed protein product [Microthlaspi erraticum]
MCHYTITVTYRIGSGSFLKARERLKNTFKSLRLSRTDWSLKIPKKPSWRNSLMDCKIEWRESSRDKPIMAWMTYCTYPLHLSIQAEQHIKRNTSFISRNKTAWTPPPQRSLEKGKSVEAEAPKYKKFTP